jgi:ribosomal protein L30E
MEEADQRIKELKEKVQELIVIIINNNNPTETAKALKAYTQLNEMTSFVEKGKDCLMTVRQSAWIVNNPMWEIENRINSIIK